MDYNAELKSWPPVTPKPEAGKGHIEKPEDVDNIVWQTRSAAPSEYETKLCQALEVLFQNGIEQLSDIVAGLNQAGLKTPAGVRWTEDSFQAEIKRLGA